MRKNLPYFDKKSHCTNPLPQPPVASRFNAILS